jgi:hypothetical protein
MTLQRIAAALQRVESILNRRPAAGLHVDEPAVARWEGGTRVVSRHRNGASGLVARSQACSPMPVAATRALPIEVSVEVLER